MGTQQKKTTQQGFTLIELSIVIVIIGLLAGGVLVGRDLIQAAEMRGTVAQLEKYEAAVNTFRGKYNGMPGDLNNAARFFAAADVAAGTNCAASKEGNGALESCVGNKTTLTGEPVAFWKQLAAAGMIPESLSDTNGAIINSAALPTTANFPAAKMGKGNYIVAYTGGNGLVASQGAFSSSSILRITGFASTPFAAGGAPTFANSLTPLEAYQMDAKRDDGNPMSGTVQASDFTSSIAFNTSADKADNSAATGQCINDSTVAAYSTTSADGNTPLCQLLVRASF